MAEAPTNPGKEEVFFRDEERILNDIAGSSVFTFKRGNNWSINPKTGEATYDPKFFEEQGYTPSQSLFGAFHEIRAHLVETAEMMDRKGGQRAHQSLKSRIEHNPWLHIWENCRTDVKGNLAITSFAPSLTSDMRTVYREKLWPETDFTDKPRHLQFMYAVLRRAMVPDEEVAIDPEVAEAIDKLRNVKGRDVIELATNPRQDPLLALRLSQKYIEPVLEELYKKDKEDKQKQKQSGDGEGQGEPSDSSGEQDQQGQGDQQGSKGGEFAEDYEDYEKRHPEPFEEDEKEVEKKIKETVEAQSTTSRKEAGYEEEHGVAHKDVDSYYQEFQQVEQYIEPVREIFRKIIEQRTITVEQLVTLQQEGFMIDPALIVRTHIEAQSGVKKPSTKINIEGRFIEENIPGKADVYFLFDQSMSMAGDKARMQRQGAIVDMEALKEGADMLDEGDLPEQLRLDIQTALYGFGVPDRTKQYKELSKGLSEKQRIDTFNGLLELGDIGTNDYDGVVAIEKDIQGRIGTDPSYAEGLKSGKRRVAVVVTTDGGSNYQGLSEKQARAQTRKKVEDLRRLGVKVKAIAFVPDSTDLSNIRDVYGADHVAVCESIDRYPESKTEVLKEILGDMSISGKPEDVVV